MEKETGIWLPPGDTLWTGAFEGGEWSLVYLGDDGTMWTFDLARNGEALGPRPIGWYHDASTVVTNGFERDPRVPGAALDALREPLLKSSGTMNLRGLMLHHQVIDALARELSVEEWVPGKVLRYRLGAMPPGALDSISKDLSPRFLRGQRSDDEIDSYTLTLAGLLASDRAKLVLQILGGTLGLLRTRFHEDPRFAEFLWKDVAAFADDDLHFAWAVIRAAGLVGKGELLGEGAVFGIPRDIEELACLKGYPNFQSYLRSGRSGRVSPTAPVRIVSPPILVPREASAARRFPDEGVLIVYSWDEPDHSRWVRRFAERLERDGVPVILDQFHLRPGDEISLFMEQAVTHSRHVLIICTAKYKVKANFREGGAGYEGSIIAAERLKNDPKKAFIPVLRGAEGLDTLPIWARGIYALDLRGDPYSEENYQELLKRLRE